MFYIEDIKNDKYSVVDVADKVVDEVDYGFIKQAVEKLSAKIVGVNSKKEFTIAKAPMSMILFEGLEKGMPFRYKMATAANYQQAIFVERQGVNGSDIQYIAVNGKNENGLISFTLKDIEKGIDIDLVDNDMEKVERLKQYL